MISQSDKDALIDTSLSGLLCIQSPRREEDIPGIRAASNIFSILAESGFPGAGKAGPSKAGPAKTGPAKVVSTKGMSAQGGSLKSPAAHMPDPGALLVKFLASEKTLRDFPVERSGASFRIMVSVGNELRPVDRGILARAESLISENCGLRSSRSGADIEFWLIMRSEGRAYLCMRLSRRRATESDLERGELKPEIAQALCLLAAIKPGEKILDPFCGSAAIGRECLDTFEELGFDSGDIDSEKVKRAEAAWLKTKGRGPKVQAHHFFKADFFDTQAYQCESYHAIITDPPWGSFEGLSDPAGFYRGFATRCAKLLCPGGRLVFLSGAKEAAGLGIEAEPALELKERHEILVSGKKASLFLCVKRPSALP